MIERYARPRMKRVWSDENKYDKWLAVELAVCEAWTEEGTIPVADMEKLRGAQYNIERLNEVLAVTKHDMTAFMKSVTEQLGPEGRWLHLGITTSDIWDTATSLQMLDAADLLDEEIGALIDAIETRAREHKHTIMMGRTHGVHAEPITFGLKLAVWWDEMRRNRKRLAHARAEVAVGQVSGPVGTHATVSPAIEESVCRHLGIAAAPVSNQIIQRDRHAVFITTLAVIAASLEKFATEFRGMQRTEIREVEEPFNEGQTGSSSMPHKRNPELTERVCGLARLIRGHAVTSLENVALWGERDISHSSAERLILPDSCMALDYIVDLFAGVIRGMRVYPERMKQNMELTRGLLFSQRLMLAMVEKGMSRDDAYKIAQNNSSRVWEEEADFRNLIRSDSDVAELLDSNELDGIFDYGYYVRYVDHTFERVGLG
ncbi:MAG: adenylosuccinate lyase [SAR202 cluster bacterium]|jgi:adenylosuccinate lyase|nr:adenylosuccinate lyase [Chloroflexota bacterium]MDP6420305.1 adenylosuccinate lyase [SAR202 cluster bacterium]HAL46473.1 adenylosuccinate lyase [Dehalococcoidia bacterium]MDP6665378.1 adenylosuccinate lyase [SAR202 cluster bacterium]MDP6801094.1 adenylosuccinate lyase [SAR202 cluster bacterium]|tara:strand:- start:2823 stop:4115 length:1293 start_codon:yes stop_codon:yes gene_type:complete